VIPDEESLQAVPFDHSSNAVEISNVSFRDAPAVSSLESLWSASLWCPYNEYLEWSSN
jgi:hypothetical protein